MNDIWTAISAIGTLLACIIALVTTRIPYSKKLKINIDYKNESDILSKNVSYLLIDIINKGHVPISIKNIYIIIGFGKYKKVIQFNANFYKKLNQPTSASLKFPIYLDIIENILIHIDLNLFKEYLQKTYSSKYLKKHIRLVIVDQTHKENIFYLKSIKYYLNKLERKRKWK